MESKDVSLVTRISGDQDGDSTLFGGVLTNHSHRLFTMTSSKESSIRMAVLQVLGLLLRQGLVNPNDAVPHLFAMQGDLKQDTIRKLALELLTREGEKRPDILRRRICAGVKQAYEFQRTVGTPGGEISSIISRTEGRIECIFSSVFRDCIGSSRKQRHGFFKNLLGLFKLNSNEKSSSKDLLLLSYVAQMLSHLDYRTVDDPLFIIHEVSAIVVLQANDVVDKLSAVLRPVGLSCVDPNDDDLMTEDDLEKASKLQDPAKHVQQLASTEFDLGAFKSECKNATVLTLLLRLKSFLRRGYSLSELRCMEYDPSTTERIADKAVSKSGMTKPFNAYVPLTLVGATVERAGINDLIHTYAEYRRLLREESSMENDLKGEGSIDEQDKLEQPVYGTPSAKKRRLGEA